MRIYDTTSHAPLPDRLDSDETAPRIEQIPRTHDPRESTKPSTHVCPTKRLPTRIRRRCLGEEGELSGGPLANGTRSRSVTMNAKLIVLVFALVGTVSGNCKCPKPYPVEVEATLVESV